MFAQEELLEEFKQINMEEYIIKKEYQPYCVRFESDKYGWITGAVYPVMTFEGEDGFLFESATMGSDYSLEYHPDKNNCRQLFEWSFCWRGVWEGRVYFKEDEYWSEQIQEMADIWKRIEVDMKAKVKELNPNVTYYD